jgi:hypothetical protein
LKLSKVYCIYSHNNFLSKRKKAVPRQKAGRVFENAWAEFLSQSAAGCHHLSSMNDEQFPSAFAQEQAISRAG